MFRSLKSSCQLAMLLTLTAAIGRCDDITIPLSSGGSLEIVDAQFIQVDQFNIYHPDFSFRLPSDDATHWTNVQVQFDIGGFCKGEVRQWSFLVDLTASKKLYHITVESLTNKLQFCRAEIIDAQIAGTAVQPPKFTMEDVLNHQKVRQAKQVEQKRLADEERKREADARAEAQAKEDGADLKWFADSVRVTYPRLPAHFIGNDIVQLFKAHEALRTAEKSEYETSDQFNKRIEAAEARFFSRTTLAFVVPAVSAYDADQRLLNVGVECSSKEGGSRSSIPVKRQKTTREYLASNAFGAKRDVQETDVESFNIGIANRTDFTITHAQGGSRPFMIMSSIKSTPDEARQIKVTLSALVICSIRPGDDVTTNDTIYDKATFDDPYEYFEQMHVLNTRVLAIWFFDSLTGRVYEKLAPERRQNPTVCTP
jgi:hypothetical protein